STPKGLHRSTSLWHGLRPCHLNSTEGLRKSPAGKETFGQAAWHGRRPCHNAMLWIPRTHTFSWLSTLLFYTLEPLVKAEETRVPDYQRAVKRGEEIWKRPEARSAHTLAPLLGREQSWFERNCGGRWPGQEVMVLAGFGALWTTAEGFGRHFSRARMLHQAFQASWCSNEVTGRARDMAEAYGLTEEQTDA